MDDIKYVLNPTFGKEQIAQLDTSDKQSRAIDGSMYSPGIVGLNNIKANDYCNVILQVNNYFYFGKKKFLSNLLVKIINNDNNNKLLIRLIYLGIVSCHSTEELFLARVQLFACQETTW